MWTAPYSPNKEQNSFHKHKFTPTIHSKHFICNECMRMQTFNMQSKTNSESVVDGSARTELKCKWKTN